MKVDVIKILVSNSAIVGIVLLWFNFNQTVFYVVRDIIENTFNENDAPVVPKYVRYAAEEPGYDDDSDDDSDEDSE